MPDSKFSSIIDSYTAEHDSTSAQNPTSTTASGGGAAAAPGANPSDSTSSTNTTTTDTAATNTNPNTAATTTGTTASDSAPSYTGMAASAASTAASTAASAAVGVKDNVFSMFGGGPKKEGKAGQITKGQGGGEGKEEENDRSGSSKAKAAEAREKEAELEKQKEGKDDEAVDVEAEPEHHFEPVVHLTEQVAVVTGEENHEIVHKVRAKMYKFEAATTEWKERGVGELKLLKDNVSGKTKLVMRRDKTWKVCATHYITALAPLDANIGSDRSWVYTAYYDVSEGMDPTKGVTVAIKFANRDAALEFKEAYEKYGAENDALKSKTTDTPGESTAHEAAAEKEE